MARALIVGCGCHGRDLGVALAERGWMVRGTTRGDSARAIAKAGLEAAIADPDRPGTLLDLVGDVSLVVWLLATADGDAASLDAIHGPRLERLLERLVDTPVRAFAYESGDGATEHLARGREIVAAAGERWRIPVSFIASPRSTAGWAGGTAAQLDAALAGR